jgi:NAD(P)H-hydrate epimerase
MEPDVITSKEMRCLEKNAEYFGISTLQLMENAGHAVASEIFPRFPSKKTRIIVFCGLGGNGGDGFVAARHLLSQGYKIKVVVAGKTADITNVATRLNAEALCLLKDQVHCSEISNPQEIRGISADVIIDALLGIGLKGSPRSPILEMIEKMNYAEAFRVAVDVPSGLNSDTGDVAKDAVRADLTVTFHKAKSGLLKAKNHVGELVVKSIGLPRVFEHYAGPGDVLSVVRSRPLESHKGDYGKLLVIGGSETFVGAPALVALAALRTGIDLAYIAAPEKTAHAISSMNPNLITIRLKGANLNVRNVSRINEYVEKVNAVVLGPGLGLFEETKEAVHEIVATVESSGVPLLLDADGLKAFSEFKRPLKIPAVLTPHEREFTILTGKELRSDLNEKVESVKKAAGKLEMVILLKRNIDIISDGKLVKLNFTGNPGMTVGGTGDVLSGVVGAFLAQQIDPFNAAVAGAFVNGAAGDFAARERGHHMLATDLLDCIPQVIDDPMAHLKVRTIAP